MQSAAEALEKSAEVQQKLLKESNHHHGSKKKESKKAIVDVNIDGKKVGTVEIASGT